MRLRHPASQGGRAPPSDILKSKFQHRPTPHFPIIKIHHLGVAPSGSIQESIRYPFICKSSRLASGHSRVFASRINPDESKSAKPRLPIKMSPPFVMKHSRDTKSPVLHHVYFKTINLVNALKSHQIDVKTSVCNKKAGR
jgi:hypothetical protein